MQSNALVWELEFAMMLELDRACWGMILEGLVMYACEMGDPDVKGAARALIRSLENLGKDAVDGPIEGY